MKEEIRQAILAKIRKAHEKQPSRGIEANAERLADDILARYSFELRGGKITNKNGIIQPIEDIVGMFVQAAPYILANPDDSKFISKHIKPGPDVRKRMADEVEKVFMKLSKIDAVIPIDPDNYTRALGIMSKHYLWEVVDGEVMFARLHESGIIHPEARMTWDEIKASHISHLIDPFRTEHAYELKQAERRQIAMKLLGDDARVKGTVKKGAKTTVYAEGEQPKDLDPISEKMNVIRKNEILSEIPKRVLPAIPKSEIIREAQRRECAVRQWGELEQVINGGGQRLHQLNQVGKFHLEELADTSAIRNQLKEIQPQPAPQYEGISY